VELMVKQGEEGREEGSMNMGGEVKQYYHRGGEFYSESICHFGN